MAMSTPDNGYDSPLHIDMISCPSVEVEGLRVIQLQLVNGSFEHLSGPLRETKTKRRGPVSTRVSEGNEVTRYLASEWQLQARQNLQL